MSPPNVIKEITIALALGVAGGAVWFNWVQGQKQVRRDYYKEKAAGK